MSFENHQIKLTIQIQNELGWTIKGENAYGPGSVIQGRVDMEIFDPALIEKAENLRIVFHGSERTRNKSNQAIRRRQFFGTQRKLWESKNSSLLPHAKYSYPFTLQLPMVQFPPTCNSDLYRCYFMLTVFLDQAPGGSEENNLAFCDLELHYQPFLETCLFKTPITKCITHRAHAISLSTYALDYVSGDTILVDVEFPSQLSVASIIEMDLYQTILCPDQSSSHILISSLQQAFPPSSSSSSSIAATMTRMNLGLSIPIDATPSFSFSDMASVSYKLVIKLKEKKYGLPSLLPLAVYNTLELPVRIGTLGYGIRAPESLQVYSIFKTAFDIPSDERPLLPLPAFIKNVEYEESLPLYQSDRLPTYDDALYYDNTFSISISAPSPASC